MDSTIDRFLGHLTATAWREHPHTLSDEDFKNIREHVDPKEVARALLMLGGPFTGEELAYIHENCDAKFDYPFEHAHQWRSDVLDKYAEHIKNYYYNYKPEAQALDPSIDPNEEHIGPMAQDVEQVNPAAVKENAEGIKSVDTGRLALMNAGAIADLARQVKEMRNAG